MTRFLRKAGLLLLANALLYLALAAWGARDEAGLQPWDREAVLPFIPENRAVELVLLGSSHARVFTSYQNERRVEEILGHDVLNLAKPALGVVPNKILLDYFYSRGNKAKRVVYLLDYFAMFDARWNEDSVHLASLEPFRWDFLFHLIRGPASLPVLTVYLREAVRRVAAARPEAATIDLVYYPNYSSLGARQVVDHWFPHGLSKQQFLARERSVLDLARSVRARGGQMYFFLPGAHFSLNIEEDSGRYTLPALLKRLREEEGAEGYDCGRAMRSLVYFRDADHFNTPGVVYFAGKLMAPALRGVPGECVRL